MVIVSHEDLESWDPLQMAIHGSDPNYLLNGLILQGGDDGDDDGDIWTCRRMLKVVWSQNLVHSGNLT